MRRLMASVPFLVAATSCTSAGAPADEESYVQSVETFRAEHEESYRRQYVPLGGLHVLRAGENRAGSAPSNDVVLPARVPATIGRFVLEDSAVWFEPEAGAGVTLRGEPVTAPVTLEPDTEGEPDELVLGDLALWVHPSGDRQAIRVRDPQSEAARSFAGFTWFPIDPAYRVTGRFIRDAEPRTERLPTLNGDYADYTTEGVVEFTLQGETVRLRPMTTRPGRLFFIFRDGTSGEETYEAARFVYADLADDGSTVLDFNQAYNPPCAFNPYTTCPIPPAENRLAVRILAGERAYPHSPEPAS